MTDHISNGPSPKLVAAAERAKGSVAPVKQLTLHMGEDYAVAMFPDETTDRASIYFGNHTDDDFCASVVRAVNEREGLIAALDHVEAVMTIVEPRSNKAEYLETLHQVRAALSKAGRP